MRQLAEALENGREVPSFITVLFFAFSTMYWADWGNHPKIETAAMDGTLRQTLVHENIQWPTGECDIKVSRQPNPVGRVCNPLLLSRQAWRWTTSTSVFTGLMLNSQSSAVFVWTVLILSFLYLASKTVEFFPPKIYGLCMFFLFFFKTHFFFWLSRSAPSVQHRHI